MNYSAHVLFHMLVKIHVTNVFLLLLSIFSAFEFRFNTSAMHIRFTVCAVIVVTVMYAILLDIHAWAITRSDNDARQFSAV